MRELGQVPANIHLGVRCVEVFVPTRTKQTYYFTDLAHGSMKAGSKGTKDPSKSLS